MSPRQEIGKSKEKENANKKTKMEPERESQCKPRPKGKLNNRDLEKHTILLPYNMTTREL